MQKKFSLHIHFKYQKGREEEGGRKKREWKERICQAAKPNWR